MKARLYTFMIVAIMAAVVVTSCKTSGTAARPKYPARLSPEIQQRYDAADTLYRAGSLDAADKAFADFIGAFEYNELTDEARFKRGEIRFAKNKYADALPLYQSATGGVYNPSISPRAYLKAGICLYRLKRYGEVIDSISKISREGTSPALLVQADSLGMLAARKAGWSGKAITRFALFLVDDYIDLGGAAGELAGKPDIISQDVALSFVRHWVKDESVTESDLNTLPATSYAKKPSGGYFLYKQAMVRQRYGDFKGATALLKKFTHGYPKNEYYEQAKALLAETSVRSGSARFKVGVILPLSGAYRVYGESVLHGVECALGIYAPCEGPKDIQMVVKDSQGNPGIASEAVTQLANEDVQVIIGPLLSATVSSAATKAQSIGMPMITLSQHEGIAAIGNFIFRNSVTSRSEVDSLVDYAAGKRKLKRYSIFYPDNRKGIEFKTLFTESVRTAGGRVVSAKSYNPHSQDLSMQMRGMQMQSGQIDLTQEGGKQNFDALFLPGSSWTAAFIAPTLAMMGMENVQLLGTMRWNDPNLIKRGGKYLDGAVFVQAFDANSKNPHIHDFVERYRKAYGRDPTLLEGLGYDSMKMILNASSQGAQRRTTIRDSLAGTKDYPGVTGRMSVDERGDIEHKLKVMMIKGGTAREAD